MTVETIKRVEIWPTLGQCLPEELLYVYLLRSQGVGPAAPATAPSAGSRAPMFLLTFFSNFWIIFGKLLEARSRLYRSQILQLNTRLKARDAIYKIYTYALRIQQFG